MCILETKTKILPQIAGGAGLPEEVAALITDCSDEATVVNGADIAMNGGHPMSEVGGRTAPTGIGGQEDIVTHGERGAAVP